MVQDIEEIYEIDNQKYKVITRSIENSLGAERIYDILGKFAIAKLEKEERKD